MRHCQIDWRTGWSVQGVRYVRDALRHYLSACEAAALQRGVRLRTAVYYYCVATCAAKRCGTLRVCASLQPQVFYEGGRGDAQGVDPDQQGHDGD